MKFLSKIFKEPLRLFSNHISYILLQEPLEVYYLKGAPEKVLSECKFWGSNLKENDLMDVDSNRIMQRANEMGSRGLRGNLFN